MELESEVEGEQPQAGGGDGGFDLSVVVAVADFGRMLVVGFLGGGHIKGGCQHPVVAHLGQPLR